LSTHDNILAMQNIKISLILTTYNSLDNFCQTMESILGQDYPNYEIVVKDGGSTDGTLEKIAYYQQMLGERFVSKTCSDTGIYDAMNQGFALSSGQLVVFFNDLLAYPQALSDIVSAYSSFGPDCIGVHSDLNYMSGEKIVRAWRMGRGHFRSGWMPGHPTLFLKRSVYEDYGLYDSSLKISADYEFMIRSLYKKEHRLAYLPRVTVHMFYGGTSSASLSSYLLSLKEGHYALVKNKVPLAFQIDLFRTSRVILQLLLGKIRH